MSTVTITVQRFDPSVDAEPHETTYEVPWVEYMTVLQGLHHINENFEPLAFDYSCRGGLCGRCGVMVNGEPVLACFSVIEEGESITVEPLTGFPVIRDLVVDRSSLEEALMEANAEVQTENEIDIDALPEYEYEEWWQDFHRKNMCRECGLCFVVCPVYQQDSSAYAGPAVFSQIYMRAFDGLDTSDRIAQAVDLGLFNCTECGACNNVCPSYINHVNCNVRLKEAARERGLDA